jgi:signal transduction histidine kinase
MFPRSQLVQSLLLSAVTLGIYALAFTLQSRVSALPADFPRESLSYPAQVGEVVVESPDRLRFVAEGASPGEALTIVDAEGTVYHPRVVRRRDIAYMIVIGISGLFFWSVATFIFAPRLERPGARSFFRITFLYGLSVMIGGIYFPGDRTWLSYAMGYLQLTSLAVLPVVFLHLTLTFPDRSVIIEKMRWLIPVLSVVTVGIVAWQIAVFQLYFLDPGPGRGSLLDAPQTIADVLLVAETVAGFAILFLRGVRTDVIWRKRQIYWLLWGFTVGAGPYVFLRTLPGVFGMAIPTPSHFDRIFEMAIPTAFVVLVVRHRFLDIDIILRRGLMYTVIAVTGLVVYLVMFQALGGYIETRVSGRAGIVLLMAGLAAGLAFGPLRRWMGSRVDRAFFKLAYDYDRAGRDIRGALNNVAGQEELVEVLARRIGHVLHPATLAVIVRAGRAYHVAGDLPRDVAVDAFRFCEERGDECAETFAASESTTVPERETGNYPSRLLNSGFVLVAPIRDEDKLMGLIMLGRRRTERRYIEPDLTFLDDCCGMTSGVLARIELVQTVAAESVERERLDEINQAKTEFLSRVSHDLRTPLSSISWSSQNLMDGVVGKLNEEQLRYVESIRTSGDQLSQLVANLLAASRIDQGRIELDRERVNIVEIAENAISAVWPIAEREEVSLELRPGSERFVVAGHTAALREVVINILDNAVRYSPPRSAVEVEIRGDGARKVAVEVRDHGPGIDETILDTIFDPHSRGERSPYSSGRGFGLGLHIVRTHVEQMGGSVEATNHPDGGALFTCRLLRWPVTEEVSE